MYHVEWMFPDHRDHTRRDMGTSKRRDTEHSITSPVQTRMLCLFLNPCHTEKKKNKMPRPFLISSQFDYLLWVFDRNSHIKWQIEQIQISWLQKPTDLDLHCLLRQGMPCLAREGLIQKTSFSKKYTCNDQTAHVKLTRDMQSQSIWYELQYSMNLLFWSEDLDQIAWMHTLIQACSVHTWVADMSVFGVLIR